jgi:signal peptidase I
MLKYPASTLLIAGGLLLWVLIVIVRAIRRGDIQRAATEIKGIAGVLVTGTIIVTFIIQSTSMPPETAELLSTFEAGDHLFIRKTDYFVRNPERGELVQFRLHSEMESILVSRVIGLPGEAVRIENGTVWINEQPLTENYVTVRPSYRYSSRMPADGYFLLPDRRAGSFVESAGSQHWGIVRRRDIIGCLWFRYWPLKRIGFVPRPSYQKEW